MKRILVILLIVFIYNVFEDRQNIVEERKRLEIESKQGAPDSNRKVDHFDWETNEFVYTDEIEITKKPKLSFKEDNNRGYYYYNSDEDENGEEAFVDEVLYPYLEKFIQYNHQYSNDLVNFSNVKLVVEFDTKIRRLESDVGQCITGYDYVHIKMDPRFWQNHPESREAIFLHECGHCFLGRSHTQFKYGDRVGSLMDTNIANNYQDYSNNKEYYLNELFNPTN